MNAVSILFATLGFLGVAALCVFIIRRFIFDTQWFLSDLYFVVVSLSVVTACVVSSLGVRLSDPHEIPREILLTCVICLLIDVPLILGAWLGLNFARRLDVKPAFSRIGLICVGWITVFTGLFAIYVVQCTVFGLAILTQETQRAPEIAITLGAGWVITAFLALPYYLVETRCRAHEKQAPRTRPLLKYKKTDQSVL